MKLCLQILAIAIVAATLVSLIGCAAPATFNYSNVSISLTYTPCAANCSAIVYNPASPTTMVTAATSNGCVNIYATVKNAPANITYTLYPTPNLVEPSPLPTGTTTSIGEQASSVGTVNYTSGTTNFYCPPTSTVPTYKGAALQQAQALGIPQGDVLLVAGVPNNPSTPSSSCVLPSSPGCATFAQLLQLYNTSNSTGPPTVLLFPSTPTGYTNSAATIPHNTSFQFNGFAVGAPPCLSATACLINGIQYPTLTTDNNIIWEVGTNPQNAVPCTVASLCPEGTITSTGLYTAPATVPATQPVVVAVAELVPAISVSAYITIN